MTCPKWPSVRLLPGSSKFTWLGTLVKLLSNFNVNRSVSRKALAESQGEINRLGANERPGVSVAKAANWTRRAVQLISCEVLSRGFAGAGEYARVKPMLGGGVGNVGLAEQVGPIKAGKGVPGRIILQKRSQEWSGLSQGKWCSDANLRRSR